MPVIIIVAAAAAIVLLVVVVLLLARRRRSAADEEPAGSFLSSRPQDTFAGLGEPEHAVEPADDEFRLDWGSGDDDLLAPTPRARRERVTPAGPAAAGPAAEALAAATDGLEPAEAETAAAAVELERAETEFEPPAGTEAAEADGEAGAKSAAQAGGEAGAKSTAQAGGEAGAKPAGEAETVTEPEQAEPEAAEPEASAEPEAAEPEASAEPETSAEPESLADAEEETTLPGAPVREEPEPVPEPRVPRMVPLSDIIVTTSRKMVDLDDPDVRRMLTELVRYEIDQAAEFSGAGQSVDAVLQLTEAEKVSRALGMDETAARIKTMMGELRD